MQHDGWSGAAHDAADARRRRAIRDQARQPGARLDRPRDRGRSRAAGGAARAREPADARGPSRFRTSASPATATTSRCSCPTSRTSSSAGSSRSTSRRSSGSSMRSRRSIASRGMRTLPACVSVDGPGAPPAPADAHVRGRVRRRGPAVRRALPRRAGTTSTGSSGRRRGDLIARLTADPAPLFAALDRLPAAGLHGDLKLGNVGLAEDGAVPDDRLADDAGRARRGRARLVPRRERRRAADPARRGPRALPPRRRSAGRRRLGGTVGPRDHRRAVPAGLAQGTRHGGGRRLSQRAGGAAKRPRWWGANAAAAAERRL